MHPAYHSDKAGIAPDCGMALVPMYESKTPAEQASADAGLIHMPKSQQRALGVRLTTVEEQDVSRTLRTSGVVTADETRIAHVHVKTTGWVEDVYANFVGQLVHKGQPLFTFYSPDLVATQQEYLIARRGQQQLGKSHFEEVAKSSQSLMDSARERLKLWDLTDKQIANLDRTGEVSKTITIYSPVTGFITDRKVFPHASATGRHGPLHDCRSLPRLGHRRSLRGRSSLCEGGPAGSHSFPIRARKIITGRVGYSYPVLDPQTHTAKIRIDVANPGLVLKPNMLADVELIIDYGRHLVVPAEAVLNSGTLQSVFVARDDASFEPRQVTMGATVDGKTIIISGVKKGETIVESGNFLLDSDTLMRRRTPAHARWEARNDRRDHRIQRASPGAGADSGRGGRHASAIAPCATPSWTRSPTSATPRSSSTPSGTAAPTSSKTSSLIPSPRPCSACRR